jgi:hypothetical protein
MIDTVEAIVWFCLGFATCGLIYAWAWEDYEDEAEHVKREALKFYGTDLINVKATFSNGSITHAVYYTNVSDVPTKITYHLSEGYPYKTRTLLLKKIEPCGECGRKLEKQPQECENRL